MTLMIAALATAVTESNQEIPMKRDKRRITLITRNAASPARNWNTNSDGASRIIMLSAYTVLRHALQSGLRDLAEDIDRVIVDRSNTAGQYLDLLASLPPEFMGDALLIRYDDSAFLSALGRGGDRVIYALSPQDLHFYLQTHDLVLPEPLDLPMEFEIEHPTIMAVTA